MEKDLLGCCELVGESGELLFKPKPVDWLETAGQCRRLLGCFPRSMRMALLPRLLPVHQMVLLSPRAKQGWHPGIF